MRIFISIERLEPGKLIIFELTLKIVPVRHWKFEEFKVPSLIDPNA